MAIKPTGHTPPVAPADGAEGVGRAKGPRGADFASSVTATDAAQAPQETDAVHAAVREVAAELDAGRVQPGEQAVDRVIERLVVQQAEPGTAPAVLRERVTETQFLLGDDPFFVERVERMLAAARAE